MLVLHGTNKELCDIIKKDLHGCRVTNEHQKIHGWQKFKGGLAVATKAVVQQHGSRTN